MIFEKWMQDMNVIKNYTKQSFTWDIEELKIMFFYVKQCEYQDLNWVEKDYLWVYLNLGLLLMMGQMKMTILSSISCENTPAPASLEFLKSCRFLEFWSLVFLNTSTWVSNMIMDNYSLHTYIFMYVCMYDYGYTIELVKESSSVFLSPPSYLSHEHL